MNKAVILGALSLVAVVSLLVAFSAYPQQPQLESYTGKLTSGSSYMKFGDAEPHVVMYFEDGRTFTATEQLAKVANVTLNETYRVSYNATAPDVAIGITLVK